MVIFSGIVFFHLSLRSVNILSFMILWRWIRLLGLGAFFGMVGYTFFLVLMAVPPWAQTPAEGASNLLECALGRYSSSQLSEWRLPAGFDVEGAARRVADEPDVWTDGSLVDDKISGVSSAGAGCFTFRVRRLWACWNWGHWDDDVGDCSVVSACRGCAQFLGLCRLFKGLSFGVLFLLFKLMMVSILGLIIWGSFVMLVGFLMESFLPVLLSYCWTVIFFFLLRGCCTFVG